MITRSDIVLTVYQPIPTGPLIPVTAKIDMNMGVNLLNILNLKNWLSAGTALGIHRGNDLIKHDTDIDVGVLLNWNNDVITPIVELITFFKENEFSLLVSTFAKNKPTQLAFLTPFKTIFDIYFFYEGIEDEFVINYNQNGIFKKPKKFIDQLEEIEFDGYKYLFPSPIEDYLLYRYGSDWRIPRKEKASWHLDATCLEQWTE